MAYWFLIVILSVLLCGGLVGARIGFVRGRRRNPDPLPEAIANNDAAGHAATKDPLQAPRWLMPAACVLIMLAGLSSLRTFGRLSQRVDDVRGTPRAALPIGDYRIEHLMSDRLHMLVTLVGDGSTFYYLHAKKISNDDFENARCLRIRRLGKELTSYLISCTSARDLHRIKNGYAPDY